MELLRIRGVSKSFGGLNALYRISFAVEQGETLGIIGPNGAGKTTLFNVITGFCLPDEGEIHLHGKPIHRLKPDEICRRGLTRTFQIMQPFPDLSVLDNVIIGALIRSPQVSKSRKRAMEILELVQLQERSQVLAKKLTLSGRKRLEIARALATNPQILLMDESMAGLTPTEAHQTIELICKLKSLGLTFILIEHVMEIIMTLSDRILVLNYGEKIAEGSPAQIARDPLVIEAYLGETDDVGNR